MKIIKQDTQLLSEAYLDVCRQSDEKASQLVREERETYEYGDDRNSSGFDSLGADLIQELDQFNDHLEKMIADYKGAGADVIESAIDYIDSVIHKSSGELDDVMDKMMDFVTSLREDFDDYEEEAQDIVSYLIKYIKDLLRSY
jgi:hypothetical protein